MRKLVTSTFLSLDGLYADANGTTDWASFSDDMGTYMNEQQGSMGAMVLGRITYDHFAEYWPSKTTADDPGAEHMNSIQKFVFSRTLDKAEWQNSTLIKDNIQEEVKKLKSQDGKDLVIVGSGTIIQLLTNLGLIDEYRLIVSPVILGAGKQLFKDLEARHDLKLVYSKTFQNGTIALHYETINGK